MEILNAEGELTAEAWARVKELVGLGEDFEPLLWQKIVVRAYLKDESFYFPGGRRTGRTTGLRLLVAADRLRGGSV